MTREISGADMLCERLKARFEHRGVKNPAVINRVSLQKEKGKAQKTARAAHMAKEKALRTSRIEPGFTSAKKRLPGKDYRRHEYESFDAERHDFIPDGGRFGLAFEKGARIRRRAESFNAAYYERRNPDAVRKKTVKTDRKSFGSVLAEKIKSLIPKKSDKSAEREERTVDRTPIPKGVVAAILLCTVLLMVVLYTYASYTQVVADGKALQSEKIGLMVERDRLVNLLEVRDDVREIEDYATNTIGMVKSDLVETRYVSIAGGERIEVVKADEPEENSGFFSTILSAMGTNWERLLEYID